MRKFIIVLIFFWLSLPLPAENKCSSIVDRLTEGKTVDLNLTAFIDSNAKSLTMIYNPDSETSHEEAYPFAQTISVTPLRAGIVEIIVADEKDMEICSIKKSIHFDGVPISGILIFLFAGLFLFTGAFFSLRNALRGDE